LAAETQTAGAQAESGLLLPPLLTCPTETSIRLSAMNSEKATEAAVELRQEGMSGWERPQPALRVSPYDLLDWKLKDLSPATRYEYRVVLKHGTDEAPRTAATGTFRTQRKGAANYTVVLIADPHVGYFSSSSKPALTFDQVVQNASRAKAEFVLDLGD